jgi:hypothetical protein
MFICLFPGGQNIIRELGIFLLTDYNYYKDIYIKNCITSIILYISKILKIDTPTINLYYEDREQSKQDDRNYFFIIYYIKIT